jgi:2-polyprenyl-3-methyl-5-hydroxy-6-metoxy-1,4-benzoquinol methylase
VARLATRACPACRSREAETLYHQSFETLSRAGLVDRYDVTVCRACGFGFADGLPGPAEFERYYARMSKYEHEPTGGRTSVHDRSRCRLIAQQLDRIVGDRRTPILDVGCSTGALLAAFKQLGYGDLEGLDPAPACAAIAREVYGVMVTTGSAASLPKLPRRYGVVLLSAVLEHLLDPLRVLRDARLALRGDGLLFVEVPDVEGFAACARAPYQEFSIEHINFFSLESLTSMLVAAGFACVDAAHVRTPWTSAATAPSLHAVARRTGDAAPQEGLPPGRADATTRAALREYLAVSARIEESVRRRITALAARRRPVLVWGVGTHTRHLLRAGALDGLRVAAYVDSDPKYQGTELRGAPVLAPRAIIGRDEAILVSSGTLHHEIERQIREELGADNEVVLLYD